MAVTGAALGQQCSRRRNEQCRKEGGRIFAMISPNLSAPDLQRLLWCEKKPAAPFMKNPLCNAIQELGVESQAGGAVLPDAGAASGHGTEEECLTKTRVQLRDQCDGAPGAYIPRRCAETTWVGVASSLVPNGSAPWNQIQICK